MSLIYGTKRQVNWSDHQFHPRANFPLFPPLTEKYISGLIFIVLDCPTRLSPTYRAYSSSLGPTADKKGEGERKGIVISCGNFLSPTLVWVNFFLSLVFFSSEQLQWIEMFWNLLLDAAGGKEMLLLVKSGAEKKEITKSICLPTPYFRWICISS